MRLAPGYRWFVLSVFVGVAVTAVVFLSLGAVLLAVSVFVLWFLRDPERSLSGEPGVVAPADGCISVIRIEDGRVRVGVLMNVTDTHVNCASVSGLVRTVTHRPGAHKPALSKDSDRDERVDTKLDTGAGGYEVSFTAGAFARRIHLYAAPGDEPVRGQKLGHIDFDSWADVLLPPELGFEDMIVEKGESARAGETVLARQERASLSVLAVLLTLLFCLAVSLGNALQPIGDRYTNQ